MSQSTFKSKGTNPSDDDSSCSNGDREAGWGFLLPRTWQAQTGKKAGRAKNQSTQLVKRYPISEKGKAKVFRNRQGLQFPKLPDTLGTCLFCSTQMPDKEASCQNPGSIDGTERECTDCYPGHSQGFGNFYGKGPFTEKALEAIQVPSASSKNDNR